jgi:hypothetical protein
MLSHAPSWVAVTLPCVVASRRRDRSERFPRARPLEAHNLDRHRVALQELGLETRSGANRTARQLPEPPRPRIPLVLAGEVCAVIGDLLRRATDLHFVLYYCSAHAISELAEPGRYSRHAVGGRRPWDAARPQRGGLLYDGDDNRRNACRSTEPRSAEEFTTSRSRRWFARQPPPPALGSPVPQAAAAGVWGAQGRFTPRSCTRG